MAAQIATGGTTLRSSVERIAPAGDRVTLIEENFQRMIFIERKRSERSGYPFLLMLIDGGGYLAKDKNGKGLDTLMDTLLLNTRETDIFGWYKDRITVGAIFTGLENEDKRLILEAILIRVTSALRENLTREQVDRVGISFHFFPKDWRCDVPHQPSDPASYHPDLASHHAAEQETVAEHIAVIEQLSTQPPTLQEKAAQIADAILAGRKVIWFGDRASAVDAHTLSGQSDVAGMIRGTFRQPRAATRQPHLPEMTSALRRDSAYPTAAE